MSTTTDTDQVNNNEKNETETGIDLLKPGQRIKPPQLSPDQVTTLIEDNYPGIKIEKIKELVSYDDKNYYIKDQATGSEFIFKVLNSLTSKSTNHVKFEHELMIFLSKRGICTPKPKLNKNGETFSKIKAGDDDDTDENVIRLLSFIQGDIFYNVPKTKNLIYKAGQFLGRMVSSLKEFDGTLLKNYSMIWMMEHFPEIKNFTYVIENEPTKYKIVQEVLKEFHDKVIPKYPQLEKGAIHGDFNEHNLIVNPDPNINGENEIAGIIDFGDSHVSYFVFDISSALAYMMLESCKNDELDPLEASTLFIKGYEEYRKIPQIELDMLKICIAARLCQSLVYGLYSYSFDVGNDYLLITSKKGWTFLSHFWYNVSNNDIYTSFCN